MIYLLSAFLLFLPAPSFAETYVKFFQIHWAALDTDDIACSRLDALWRPHTSTSEKCRVPNNHTLHITGIGAAIAVATTIEDVDFAISVNGVNQGASEINFNKTAAEQTDACDDHNIDVDFADVGEYCWQVVDITITENTLWWLNVVAGTTNTIQQANYFIVGTLTPDGEPETQGKQTFRRLQLISDNVSDGDVTGLCDHNRANKFDGSLCYAPIDLKIKSIAMGANFLGGGGSGNCGRLSFQVDGVNQSTLEIYFGATGQQAVDKNTPPTYCDLDDGLLTSLFESCFALGNVAVPAGASFAFVALDNPGVREVDNCTVALSVIQYGTLTAELQLP